MLGVTVLCVGVPHLALGLGINEVFVLCCVLCVMSRHITSIDSLMLELPTLRACQIFCQDTHIKLSRVYTQFCESRLASNTQRELP